MNCGNNIDQLSAAVDRNPALREQSLAIFASADARAQQASQGIFTRIGRTAINTVVNSLGVFVILLVTLATIAVMIAISPILLLINYLNRRS